MALSEKAKLFLKKRKEKTHGHLGTQESKCNCDCHKRPSAEEAQKNIERIIKDW